MDTAAPTMAHPDEWTEQRLPLVFTGSARAYFQIWVVNILLTVLTLGIYSAWAKVRRMQFFYGNTKLDGDGFSYTASPIAILKGRLIAVALIVTYSVAGYMLGPMAEGALFFLLLFVFPFLMAAALRFHARVTLWRNVPFRWTGSYADVFKAYLLWPIAAMLTLGLLFPFAARAMRQVTVNRLRFGTSRFETYPPIGPFYGALFVAVVLFVGTFLGGWLVWQAFAGLLQLLLPGTVSNIVAIAWLPLFGLLGFVIAASWFAAAARNATLAALRLERGHRFDCNLSEFRFAWIRISNFLAILFSLGLLIPWAAVRAWRYDVQAVVMLPNGSLDQFVGQQEAAGRAFGAEFGGFQGVDIGV